MDTWIKVISDWAWGLLIVVGGWLGLLGRRVSKLEKDTVEATKIDGDLAALEGRLEGQFSRQFSELQRQYTELKTEIHRMNTDNAESRTRLYEKIDQLRGELKSDFTTLLDAHFGRQK